MTPIEELARQRTADRIAPGGARSAVYGSPAGQVPPGVLSSGTAPMPARTSVIEQLKPAANFAMREAIASRQSMDSGVAQRLAAGRLAGGGTSAAGGASTADRLAQVRTMSTPSAQMTTTGSSPGVLTPGASTSMRQALTGMDTTPTPRPAAGAAAPAAPAAPAQGVIAKAAQSAGRTAGRAVGTLAGGLGEAARTAGRVAGTIAGPMQMMQGAGQMSGDGGALDKVGGAVRTGAGTLATMQALAPGFTSRVLPRAGAVGAAAAAGMTAGDLVPESWIDALRTNSVTGNLRANIREALGFAPDNRVPGQQRPASAVNAYGPSVAEATGVQQPGRVPPNIDPSSGDWNAINGQSRATQSDRDVLRRQLIEAELARPNLDPQDRAYLQTELRALGPAGPAPAGVAPAAGPIARAAHRAPARMSAAGQSQVARLQQMAGGPVPQSVAQREPVAEVVAGPVGMAYGGDPTRGNVARPVYGMSIPGAQGAPDGDIEIIRGLQRFNATPDGTGFGYDEQLKGIPELKGDSYVDLARWAVDLEARGLGRAPDLIARYLATQQGNQTQLEQADLTSGRQLAGVRTNAAAGIEQARIQAAANRYAPVTEGVVTDPITGRVTQTRESGVFDRQTGEVRRKAEAQKREMLPEREFDTAIRAVMQRDRIDEATARRRVESVYQRGE